MAKRLLIILLIAIFVSVSTAISYFLFFDKESDILSKVPKNAKSVIIIDLKSLSTKLLLDELSSDTKSVDKLSEMLPDSLYEIDWTVSGINLFDEAVLFSTQNASNDSINVNLILPITNFKEFKKFIKTLSKSKFLDVISNISKKTAYSKQYKILISWNKKFVIATFLSKNQKNETKALSNILSLKKKKSIMADSSFLKKQTTNYDILFYSLPYSQYPKKYNAFINSNIQSVISFISFKDGELEIKTELSAKNESLLEKLFHVNRKEQALLNTSDSCALNIVLDINPDAFFKIIEQYSSIKLKKERIPIISVWNGKANIAVNGTKTIENKYVSYEYDDDFNKIEITKTVKDKIWDIQAILGINNSIIDSVLQKSKLYRSKKDTLLFKGSNFIIKKIGNNYLCYNKNINQPKLHDKSKTGNIVIELNYRNFIPLLKKLGIESDTTYFHKFDFEKFKLNIIKKEQINISCSFYFTDKDKNSFFTIAEKCESKDVE